MTGTGRREGAMRAIRAALVINLMAGLPALAQAPAGDGRAEAMRGLARAEARLREAVGGLEAGGMPPAIAAGRLRAALDEVERAMLRLPPEARTGAPWQEALREVAGALALLRDGGAGPAALRDAAGEALATLPALRGAVQGSGGG